MNVQLIVFSLLVGWALSFQSFHGPTNKLEWTRVSINGDFPLTAVSRRNGGKLFNFCEVEINETVKIPGITTPLLDYCEYELNGVASKSMIYNVLTNPHGVVLEWKYSTGAPPAGAVKCNQGDNCYLGESVYGDGICVELPGKIFTGQTQMIMAFQGAIHKCPFNTYLVQK